MQSFWRDRRWAWIAAPLVCLTIQACSGRAALLTLAIAGRTNAETSLAARDRFVVVSWAAAGETATDIYTAVSRDGGRAFANPVRVNDATTIATVSGEQPPRVAIVPRSGRDPGIVVVWTAMGASGTRLLAARSEDGGASFSAATTLPGTDAAGNRGWESTAVDPKGRVIAIWLDHRDLAMSGPSSSMPMHHEGQMHTGHGDVSAVAHAQLSKLYVGTVGGDDGRAITGGVCYCCKTALAAGADGAIYAAWRHVYPGNIRDIAFTMSRDGGRTFAAPEAVSHDQWALDGCPENGPAMAVDRSNAVHVVWPTLVTGAASGGEPNLALFHAVTGDGARFSPREPLPTEGTPRHPVVAIGPSASLLVAWDEQEKGTRRVAMAVGGADSAGAGGWRRFTADDPARCEYPAVAGTDEGFVAAWSSRSDTGSVIHVTRIADPR